MFSGGREVGGFCVKGVIDKITNRIVHEMEIIGGRGSTKDGGRGGRWVQKRSSMVKGRTRGRRRRGGEVSQVEKENIFIGLKIEEKKESLDGKERKDFIIVIVG